MSSPISSRSIALMKDVWVPQWKTETILQEVQKGNKKVFRGGGEGKALKKWSVQENDRFFLVFTQIGGGGDWRLQDNFVGGGGGKWEYPSCPPLEMPLPCYILFGFNNLC